MNVFGGKFKNKRILITGHTGFKGSWLSLWLTMMGAHVTCLGLEPIGERNHWRDLKMVLPEHIVDLRNSSELANVVKSLQPEIIFHLAAQALVVDSYRDPLNTWSTNVMGTVNLLEAVKSCEALKVFVVVTSDKCYENKEWVWSYRETDALGGRDPYSASKAAAELVVASYRQSYFSQKQIGLISVRAGNVIGGGDWSDFRIIPDLVKTAFTKVPAEIRAPEAIRPWQHVLESLSGYLCLVQKCLDNSAEYSGAWNFGPMAGADISVGVLAEKAKSYWNEINYREIKSSQYHEATYLSIDSSKARHYLQWRPVWEFNEALEKTINWYKNFYSNKTISSENQIIEYAAAAGKQNIPWASENQSG